MSAIVWWLIPAGSVLLAIAWVAWVSRERPRADPHESVESYHRFQRAMEREMARRNEPPAAGASRRPGPPSGP